MHTVTRIGLLAGLSAAILAGSTAARAADVHLINSNAAGRSWDYGPDWSNGLPAQAGNDYHVGLSPTNKYLRTPNNVNNPAFPGDSLTIHSTGTLTLKHRGTVTVDDLHLAGGTISSWVGNRTMAVGGNLAVDADSTFLMSTPGADRRDTRLRSTLSGSGDLLLEGGASYSIFRFAGNPAAYTGALVPQSNLDRLHVETTFGNTLTVKGNGGGLDWTPFQEFDVATNGGNAKVVAPAGQPVSLGGGGGSLSVARRWSGNAGTQGELDLSGASSVDINVTNVRLGMITNGSSGKAWGTLKLSQDGDNTVTATTITLGDSTQAGNTANTSVMTLGGADNTINANTVYVGRRKSQGRLDIAAGGSVTLRNKAGTGRADLLVGRNDVNSGTRAFGEIDLSGAAQFDALLDELTVGRKTGGGTGRAVGRITLAATNTIDANTILIGSSDNGGQTGAGDQSRLILGTANAVNVDNFTIGHRKSNVLVEFAAPGGTLDLAGSSGARANLRIGHNDDNTGTNATGVLNLSGGSFNAMLNELSVGQHQQGAGSSTGILIFDAGTVDANNVFVGRPSTGGTSSNFTNTSGTITMNGGAFTAGSMTIGLNGGTGTFTANGGTVQIGAGSGDNLYVGRRTANVGTSTPTQFTGTLDVSGATSFTADVGTFGVGYVTGGGGGQGYPTGTVILSPDNTITADTIIVADSRGVGLGGKTNQITFGAANNVNVDTLTIGGSKGVGNIVVGGVLNLGGKSGARADMFVGNQPVGTGGGSNGTADFSAGTINAMLDDLVIAQKVSSAAGTTLGTFTMADGTVDVNNVLLANRIGGGGGPVIGTFNLQGGTLKAATIDDGGNGGTANFNFTGGVLHVDTFGFTLNQDGGTLAAGDSPGTTLIAADYLFDAGILEVEINGLAQGSDPGYDFYDVVGDADLGNNDIPDGWATLQVFLRDGFLPVQGTKFDVLTATDITIGTDFRFDDRTGGQWRYEVIPGGRGEILQLTAIVPEPASLAIWALLGALGLAGWRRRGRR